MRLSPQRKEAKILEYKYYIYTYCINGKIKTIKFLNQKVNMTKTLMNIQKRDPKGWVKYEGSVAVSGGV